MNIQMRQTRDSLEFSNDYFSNNNWKTYLSLYIFTFYVFDFDNWGIKYSIKKVPQKLAIYLNYEEMME